MKADVSHGAKQRDQEYRDPRLAGTLLRPAFEQSWARGYGFYKSCQIGH
jgi:hypothetical protein